MEKIFYKCCGFKTDKKLKKPIFFFHTPKCGGTTFAVLISYLFKKTHRIKGPLFKNNDKGGITAHENYLKNKEIINSSNLDFLYGHLPFEIYNNYKNKYLFISVIREPIERCISHYQWAISRGYCSKDDDIDKLFQKSIIPKNAIVNQFSGTGFSNYNKSNSIEFALSNLTKKIDLLFRTEDLFNLLNLIISNYNLPNLFFQNQQINKNKIKISKKNLEKIIKNNDQDINLYSKLKKNNFFKNNKKIINKRIMNKYLYSSPELLVNNLKNVILKEDKINIIENNLVKLNYKIQNV